MRDLREFHDPNLHLPIMGKDIIIKSPNADEGLKIKSHIYNGDATVQDEMRFIAMFLRAEYDEETDTFHGGLYDTLNDMGLTIQEIIHVGNTAMAHFAVNPAYGEYWWENRLGKETEPLAPEVELAAQEVQNTAKPKTRRRKKTTS